MRCVENISDACPNVLSGSSSQLFVTLLQALLTSRCSFKTDYPSDYSSQLSDGDEFDFIVVGAGSAGSIVASRLSEVFDWKVLLLEAGTYPSISTEIPMLFRQTHKSNEDWNYYTEKSDTCCLSLTNQRCLYPRGKVLGGSGSINAMMYMRSTKKDHNEWVEAGNTNWDYRSSLRHYTKVEDQLKLNKFKSETSIRTTLKEAYNELGYFEYSKSNRTGYGDTFLTIANDGTRSSSGKAFLPNTKNRTNMYLVLNAHITKVTVDQNRQATGVQALINNHLIHIKAKKEVILSSGSINTPQILMLSGIGPEEHLNNFGIPVRSNLKVGENLQDHIIFMGLFFNVDVGLVPPASENNRLDAIYNYFIHRTGPLVAPDLLSFNFYTDTKNGTQYPNLEMHHISFKQNDRQKIEEFFYNFNYPKKIVDQHVQNNIKSSGILMFPKTLTTKSRGKVLLRSVDPFDKPLIYPNFFSDKDGDDIELLLDGVKLIKKLMKTKAFSKAHPEAVELNLDNCGSFKYDTDDYWRCAIRNLGHHLHHPVGTCKMGSKSDPDAVVGPTLKVHGIKGLRVVDASVMPKITRCNTNGPTMMIGEKGAELIKQHWLKAHVEL